MSRFAFMFDNFKIRELWLKGGVGGRGKEEAMGMRKFKHGFLTMCIQVGCFLLKNSLLINKYITKNKVLVCKCIKKNSLLIVADIIQCPNATMSNS